MTLRVKVKFKIACPKHRRYDPAKHGEAGIKGGCLICLVMLDLHNTAAKLEKSAGTVTSYLADGRKAKATKA